MMGLTQIKALVKNMARERDINAQILLRNYMLERLLERIAKSTYKDKFILKGGMLIAALVGVDLRSTIDMDATIKSLKLSKESITKIVNEILLVPIEDGVSFELRSLDEIRESADYLGYRVSILAYLEEARIPIKIDITTGDAITPKEVNYRFDLLFENRSIDILAYSIETVLAEKMQTLLVRGVANTRMRDFYDLYILLKLKSSEISQTVFREALIKTSNQRESFDLLIRGTIILETIHKDDTLKRYWNIYKSKNSYVGNIEWSDVMKSVYQIWELYNGDKQFSL